MAAALAWVPSSFLEEAQTTVSWVCGPSFWVQDQMTVAEAFSVGWLGWACFGMKASFHVLR